MSGNTFHFHAITLNYQCCHFVSNKRRYCVYSRIDEAPYHRSMVFHPFQCSYFIVLLIILQRIRYFLQQSFFISKCEDMISKIRKISEKNYVGHCWLSINNHLNFLERELLVFIWFTKVSEDNFSYSQHTVI